MMRRCVGNYVRQSPLARLFSLGAAGTVHVADWSRAVGGHRKACIWWGISKKRIGGHFLKETAVKCNASRSLKM